MKYLALIKKIILRSAVIALFIWIFIFNYDFVFKKKIIGQVVAAEKVASPIAVLGGGTQQMINPQVFSFSVGIKDRSSGEIFMASSEDRQWAAVNPGNCVIAAFFPYPPWRLDKGSTNHNARLLRNFTSCDDVPMQSWFDDLKFFFLLN